MIRRASAALLAMAMTATLVVAVRAPAQAAALCASPGRDGAGTISGIVNTYYPATASAAAGATSITVGAHAAGDAGTAIAINDLLLVIQMQGATFNTGNASTYGDGTGSGATSSTAGNYEYVVATSALANTGGALSVKGTNANGLIHAYTNGAGAKYQVIRVPQYTSPTIGAALAPLAWNGTAGGVLAIDTMNLLFGNGATISADAKGFRGGQGRALAGDATATAGDYANTNAKNAHGEKAEGTAGTPTYLYTNGVGTGAGTADGYPGGDTGRGAPGNAGGGGADAHTSANDENTGGGGGGNGGAGGVGGKSWKSNLAYGGYGGTFTPSATQLVMGGGGGAGSRNNGGGYDSSGGTGGGIVMIRVAGVTGNLTVHSNGSMGVDPQNDGGGGGGAGGSVMMTGQANFSTVTVAANGANGTDADVLNAGGAAHGPGGGGGGGVSVDSGGIAATLTGGAAGVTDGSPLPDAHYGAAAGANGQALGLNYVNVPGASSGAECGTSTGTVFVGPVGVPTATGSYDGNVATTNNNDFVQKSFAPPAFTAVNSSTIVGSPNGNTYTAAVTGIALRHEVRNSGAAGNFIFYAQAPGWPGVWTVSIYSDSAGSLGAQLAGTANGTAYTTTTTVPIGAGASYFVWTVYSAPTGLQAFNRFDGFMAVIDAANYANNNEVHDELYTGYVVQTKSYTITSTACSGGVPAGTWCPGANLKYVIDVRNIAVAANGTTPASATLTANNLMLTDDGSNVNSWAKDGGYMNTPGVTCPGGTAPTTPTYYYNLTNNTAFPANYNTTNKVFKVTGNWTTLTAGQFCPFTFTAVQF